MLRWSVIGVVAVAALLSRPAVAAADPAAPQPGTPCDSSLDGAMTMPPDHEHAAGVRRHTMVNPSPRHTR